MGEVDQAFELTEKDLERHWAPPSRAKDRKRAGKGTAACLSPRIRTTRKGLRYGRRLAIVVGGIGTGLLGLSVVHCTESIGLLTGSHWALSALLAIGIDAGMVGAELAELASHGTKQGNAVRPWAIGYTIAAILLSVLLNAYAFGHHAEPSMVWAAWLLGATIPCLVGALGQIAGKLWLAGE